MASTPFKTEHRRELTDSCRDAAEVAPITVVGRLEPGPDVLIGSDSVHTLNVRVRKVDGDRRAGPFVQGIGSWEVGHQPPAIIGDAAWKLNSGTRLWAILVAHEHNLSMPSAVFVQMVQRTSGNSSGHQKEELLSSANTCFGASGQNFSRLNMLAMFVSGGARTRYL